MIYTAGNDSRPPQSLLPPFRKLRPAHQKAECRPPYLSAIKATAPDAARLWEQQLALERVEGGRAGVCADHIMSALVGGTTRIGPVLQRIYQRKGAETLFLKVKKRVGRSQVICFDLMNQYQIKASYLHSNLGVTQISWRVGAIGVVPRTKTGLCCRTARCEINFKSILNQSKCIAQQL